MKTLTRALACSVLICQLVACQTHSPKDYFETAVLNCNKLHGFCGPALNRQLESPSVRMVDGDPNKTEPMKRKEIIGEKIRSVEESLEKINSLDDDGESRGMVQASRALHEFVLPVFRNEYIKLAGLYDSGATGSEIQALEQAMRDRYADRFGQLYEAVVNAGKQYAAKNNIQVQWDISTSPR